MIAVLDGDGMKKPKRATILTNAKRIISAIHPLFVKILMAVSLVNGEFILPFHNPRLSMISVMTRIVRGQRFGSNFSLECSFIVFNGSNVVI